MGRAASNERGTKAACDNLPTVKLHGLTVSFMLAILVFCTFKVQQGAKELLPIFWMHLQKKTVFNVHNRLFFYTAEFFKTIFHILKQ